MSYTKLVKETIDRFVLSESSVTRLMRWMDSHDIAVVTAFRGAFRDATPNTLDDRPTELQGSNVAYEYSRQENKRRNHNLKACLMRLGYGVTNVQGSYIEGFGTIDAQELGEESIFVVNLENAPDFKQRVFELSEYYNQDCFLYKPKGDNNAYLIGTNNTEWPGYGNEENQGEFHLNPSNEFLTRMGANTFSFSSDGDMPQDNRRLDFKTRKAQRMREERVFGFRSFLTESPNAKKVISNIADRILRNVKC
jgi:hypothetical protein